MYDPNMFLTPEEGIRLFQLLFISLTLLGFCIAFTTGFLVWRSVHERPLDHSIWITSIDKVPEPFIQQELRNYEEKHRQESPGEPEE